MKHLVCHVPTQFGASPSMTGRNTEGKYLIRREKLKECHSKFTSALSSTGPDEWNTWLHSFDAHVSRYKLLQMPLREEDLVFALMGSATQGIRPTFIKAESEAAYQITVAVGHASKHFVATPLEGTLEGTLKATPLQGTL